MNLLIAKATKFSARLLPIFLGASVLLAQSRPVDPGLTAHEWGTFTSVAGQDGQAVEWTPVTTSGGSNELPSFVEHLHWGGFKQGLRGTVRMETPVLYFYSSREVTLSVQLALAKGLITEWYPHARAVALPGAFNDTALYERKTAGTVSWDSVTVQPGQAVDFPRDAANNDNHYYAARQTSATPLRVHAAAGDQHEKFLFYRGVSAFSVSVSAQFMKDGNLLVRNRMKEGISNVIWFERRGNKVGYRISEGPQNEVVLEPPELTAKVEQLYGDLEEILATRGLYREEAHAMVQTWRNSWFEEGSRLFYIVPARFVDTVLPLTITPAPAQTVRVFVGRLELISPATQKAVATALVSKDNATLAKYGRFLEPILSIIKEKNNPQGKQTQQSQTQTAPCDAEPAVASVKQRR